MAIFLVLLIGTCYIENNNSTKERKKGGFCQHKDWQGKEKARGLIEREENMVSVAAERLRRRERETGREIIKRETHNLVRNVTIMFPILDVMLVYD